jgi:hypothetical protein
MKNRYEVDGAIVRIFLKRKNKPDLHTTIDLVDLPIALSRPGSWYGLLMGKVTKQYYVYMNTSYAERRAGKPNGVALHRLIMNTPDDLYVDHVDHDTLNNQRSNLKNVTQAVNNKNVYPHMYFWKHTKGYSWAPSLQRWVVCVRQEKSKRAKNYYFKDEIEARDKANYLLALRQKDKLVIGEEFGNGIQINVANDEGSNRCVESGTLESANRSRLVL